MRKRSGFIDGSARRLSSTLQEVVAIDGPEPFHEWDVGGFLSPQRLAEDATVARPHC